jgi:trimethylamine:corrinoid methyltransferase-like protein
MLADYEPPAIDPAVDEELQAYIKTQKGKMADEIG